MRRRGQIVAVGLGVALSLLLPASALATADISVGLTPEPTSLPLGSAETAKVTLSATNAGPDPAANVEVKTNTGGPVLEFASFISISQGSAVQSSEKITAFFGTIAAGGTATLVYRLGDAESGLATLPAEATTSTPESNLANNNVSAQVGVVALVPSVNALLFGAQTVGGIGPAQTLTLTNGAAIAVQVSKFQLGGGDFVTADDGCSGLSLAPGATCQMAARFAPSAAGDRSGTLTASSSTAKVTPIQVALKGTGIPIDTTPASLRLAGVPKTLTADRFRKGFSVKVTPSEPVALDVSLLGSARPGALASAFELQLFSRSLPRAAGTQTIKVKPAARLLGSLRKRVKVRLLVVATDAFGNRSSAIRKIAVRPAGRR